MKSVLDIAKNICLISGDPEHQSVAATTRFVQVAVEQLHRPVLSKTKTFKVVIGPNFSAILPHEVISVRRIGVIDADGLLRTLGADDRLAIDSSIGKNGSCSCGSEVSSEVSEKAGCPSCFWGNFAWSGAPYGMVSGFSRNFVNGTYRIDNGVIYFGSGYDISEGAEILIEARVAIDGDDYETIPDHFEAAIIAYVFYLKTLPVSPVAASRYMAEFRRHKDMISRSNMPTNEEMGSTFHSAVRHTI